MGDVASKFLLDEEKYKDVLSGWNQKLNSSSLKLSGLTPFVELYAVFKSDDIIFSAENTQFSQISDRMIEVDLVNNGKTSTVKIVPICSTNKSQLEPDSIYGSSYRGAAGVNDLQVARGASASLNVKYDLQITIPNPEIVNELYEYSRIMTLNSTFLLIYGWNPEGYDVTPPPRIDRGTSTKTKILVDKKGGGFYESSLVSLYRFDFSFDNVGHLTGKLSFLPEHGNFLVGTRTDAVSTTVLKLLTSYDGQIGNSFKGLGSPFLNGLNNSLGNLEANQSFNDSALDLIRKLLNDSYAEIPLSDRIRRLSSRSSQALSPQERQQLADFNKRKQDRQKIFNIRQQIIGEIPPDWPADTEDDPSIDNSWNGYKRYSSRYESDLKDFITKDPKGPTNLQNDKNNFYSKLNEHNNRNEGTYYTNQYIKFRTRYIEKDLKEASGYSNFDNGTPWELPNDSANIEAKNLINTMPSYGKQLQKEIQDDFKVDGNPNKALFYDDNNKISDKFDAETKEIWKSSSCVSVMMFNLYDPNSEEDDDGQPESVLVEKSKLRINGNEAGVSIQAQPVYFFLGSVLQAISKSTNKRVKFFYRDLESNYFIPLPSVSKSSVEQQANQINSSLESIKKDIEEIEVKIETKKDENNEALTDEDIDLLKEELEGKKSQKDFLENSKDNLETLQPNLVDFFTTLTVSNTFEMPVDINGIKQILTQEPDAPLHNLIKKVIEIANTTNPTIKLATRTYKNSDTIEVYSASIKVDGISKEIFESLEINVAENGGSAQIEEFASQFSQKAVVCEFGTERSLVENFSLNSKVDPIAFAAFRLPSIVGGQSVDVSSVVRKNLDNNYGFLGDITDALQNNFISSKKELESLKIVTLSDKGDIQSVSQNNLRDFLTEDSPQASQVITRLIDELRASSVSFNNNVIAAQNEEFLSNNSKGGKDPSFFGGILSSFLRSITLTVHGVVGLTMFNVVYIKGLMRGIEGVYMITSVSESLTPSNFSTTLECKLVNYKNNNSKTNPFAQRKFTTLQELASEAATEGFSNYDTLFNKTEKRLSDAANRTNFTWGSG